MPVLEYLMSVFAITMVFGFFGYIAAAAIMKNDSENKLVVVYGFLGIAVYGGVMACGLTLIHAILLRI